jgi:glucose-1-phosphate cytidylyltransferase
MNAELLPNTMSALTAVILCGGKGERLRPFTDHLPKALVPLQGKPLLYHLMSYLSASGVSRFVLCVGYKAECIEQFVRESAQPNWQVECVNSGDASMADRILDALPRVPGQALICYGDILANVDLTALQRAHTESRALATLTVYPLHSPFGIIQFNEENRITGLAEKPILPHWINIGFMLCEPSAFQHLLHSSDMMEFSSALVNAGALFAYQHRGKHLTINTERERVQAEAQMTEFAHVMDYQAI